MIVQIPNVLGADQVAHTRRLLDQATWVDGRVTAGHQSARAKDNMQLAESDPVARQLGEEIVAALQRNPLFIAAALPLRVFPPSSTAIRGGNRSGTTWTTPSANRSPACGSARTCRQRSSWRSRRSTRAAS